MIVCPLNGSACLTLPLFGYVGWEVFIEDSGQMRLLDQIVLNTPSRTSPSGSRTSLTTTSRSTLD